MHDLVHGATLTLSKPAAYWPEGVFRGLRPGE
jgi:hypothetical protein